MGTVHCNRRSFEDWSAHLETPVLIHRFSGTYTNPTTLASSLSSYSRFHASTPDVTATTQSTMPLASSLTRVLSA